MVQNLGEANLLKVYGAYYQEELLASAIIIDYGGTRTYLFGGSSAEHRNVMAPYALHWQIITDAKHNGFNKYDWWGLETSRGKVEGFAQFKIRFGGQEISYPNAVDIPTNKIWYLIYAFLRKLNSYT
ncbi:MAG: peptidoglycan bridge formation glycyltransferase FemA/FemB family protein, partial [Candidatus Doudnabacteria bacterium]